MTKDEALKDICGAITDARVGGGGHAAVQRAVTLYRACIERVAPGSAYLSELDSARASQRVSQVEQRVFGVIEALRADVEAGRFDPAAPVRTLPGAVRVDSKAFAVFTAEQRYQALVQLALEATVYIAPTDHGLTLAEIREVAGRVEFAGKSFKPGGINDAIEYLLNSNQVQRRDDGRFVLRAPQHSMRFAQLDERFDPDYRNIEALDFPLRFLAERAEERGKANAIATRDEIVEAAMTKGFLRHDADVAIEVLHFAGWLKPDGSGYRAGVSLEASAVRNIGNHESPRPEMEVIYKIVAAVRGARGSAAPPSAQHDAIPAVMTTPAAAPPLPTEAPVRASSPHEGVMQSNDVFVVHGRDDAAKDAVAAFIRKLKLSAIILHEQASAGQTIIEKFERHSASVGFAVVLLTPDDEGRLVGETDLTKRARQNVIFELGYFFAKLGRSRVCALLKPPVLKPSDIDGVVWVEMDAGGAWKSTLARELSEAGIKFDHKDAL